MLRCAYALSPPLLGISHQRQGESLRPTRSCTTSIYGAGVWLWHPEEGTDSWPYAIFCVAALYHLLPPIVLDGLFSAGKFCTTEFTERCNFALLLHLAHNRQQLLQHGRQDKQSPLLQRRFSCSTTGGHRSISCRMCLRLRRGGLKMSHRR